MSLRLRLQLAEGSGLLLQAVRTVAERLEARRLFSWIGATSGSTNDLSHDYNNPLNWSLLTINDDFSSANLTANTTIYLDANRTTTGALNLGYTGNFNLTFESGSTTAVTLTLTSGITGNFGGSADGRTVTIGTATNPVNVGMNASTSALNVNAGDTLALTNTLSAGAVSKTGAGTLILDGSNTFSGGTTLSAGTLDINNSSAPGYGALTIGSGTTIDNTSGASLALSNNNASHWQGAFTFTGSNPLNLGSGPVTLAANVTVTVAANTLSVGGDIGDGGSEYSISKAGQGTLALGGASTYSGGTLVIAGVLEVYNNSTNSSQNTPTALGNTSSPAIVNFGATLWLNYQLADTGGDISYANPFMGAGILKVTAPAAANYITGTAQLTGDLGDFFGTLDLFPTSGSLGKTSLDNPTDGSQPSVLAQIVVENGTTLYLPEPLTYQSNIFLYGMGNSENLGALRFGAEADASGNVTLMSNSSIGSHVVTGAISGIIGDNGNGYSTTIEGGGTVQLLGANTYTGGTTISSGTLLIDNSSGSGTGPGNVTVNSGGTLGGAGGVSGNVLVAAGGTIQAGSVAGTAIFSTGSLTIASGGNLGEVIDGSSAGNNYDQIAVTGLVNLISGSNLNLSGTGAGGISPIRLIKNDGVDAITGSFSGMPEGASITFDNVPCTLSYRGGSGNDAVLTASGTAFVVTDTNDSGAGSLRQAIINSNNDLGNNRIIFAIPGSGVQMINVASALPLLIMPVAIDGTTQAGYAGTPLIQLTGLNAGTGANGIDTFTNDCTIKGLAITGFQGNGIQIDFADNTVIQADYIGIDASGKVAEWNGDGLDENGGAGTLIGGTTSGTRNVISGNFDHALFLFGAASDVVIEGNLIGVNAAGTAAVANGALGGSPAIRIAGNSYNIIIGGTVAAAANVIADNARQGISATSGSGITIDGNTIDGNGSLGIDLNGSGTPITNTGTKSDSQVNDGMNFPVLTGASLSNGTLSLAGYVGSMAGQSIFAGARLEFFKSDGAAGGYGQGKLYLGTLTTNASGNFSGTLSSVSISAGDTITSTATDSSGDSSEFGRNVAVVTSVPAITLSAAAVSPNPVTGTTASLSVVGNSTLKAAAITYTWTVTALPAGSFVIFSTNNSAVANNSTVRFNAAGSYTFQVTASNGQSAAVSSSISVTVDQTLSRITLSPLNQSVAQMATQQFTATALDQFGKNMAVQPAFVWSSNDGTIDGNGLFTAPAANETVSITAASGSVIGSAHVTIVPIGSAVASPSIITGTATTLSVVGPANNANTYTWSIVSKPTGAADPTYEANGSAAAQSTTASFSQAGDYTFAVVIDNGSAAATHLVSVSVIQTLSSLAISPPMVSLNENQQTQFHCNGSDQFGEAMVNAPQLAWGLQFGVGSVDSNGLYTSPGSGVAGSDTLIASSGSIAATAVITVINAAPTVATDASANPAVITGESTSLNVLGSDDGGENNLSYEWSVIGSPPAAVSFSTNGNNSAKQTVATFSTPGTYDLAVTITDAGGLSTVSKVTVTVSAAQPSTTAASATVIQGTEGTSAKQFSATPITTDLPSETPSTLQTTLPVELGEAATPSALIAVGGVQSAAPPPASVGMPAPPTATVTQSSAPVKTKSSPDAPQPNAQAAQDKPAPGGSSSQMPSVPDVRVQTVPEQIFPFLAQHSQMSDQLDEAKKQILSQTEVKVVVGSATVVSVGTSAMYFVWLLRGGSLLSSLLSIFPAWKSIDPLPVLDSFESKKKKKARMASDRESLESLVDESNSAPLQLHPPEQKPLRKAS